MRRALSVACGLLALACGPGPDEPQAGGQPLGEIGEPAVPELIRMLDDRECPQRVEAADVLAGIGPAAAAAIPALEAAGASADPRLREAAARALAAIGGAAPSAPGRGTRRPDAALLGRLSPAQGEPRPALLIAALDDPEPRARARALRSLAPGSTREAESLAPFVVRAMNDDSELVRDAARAWFAAAIADGRSTPSLLASVLLGGDPRSRAKAAWELGARLGEGVEYLPGGADPEAQGALREALGDPEPTVRIYAARALASDPAARPSLADTLRAALLEARDPQVRAVAERTLAAVESRPADASRSGR